MADNAVLARNTENAPTGVGPYSQTVAFSHYNNLAAQLPIDPKTGALVAGGVEAQAKQCVENIKAVVESIDHGMEDVIRLSVFLKDIADLEAVDAVIKSYYSDYLPTRTSVAVNALPQDALVMIDGLISNGVGTIPNAPQAGDLIKVVKGSDRAPKSDFSNQTVAFSHYSNVSAQLPIDPKTGKLVAGGVAEQAKQALANVKAILEDIDVPFDDIVKITVHLTNLADLDAFNEVYTTFFPDSAIARTANYFPARTVVEAAALPLGALVQVEAVLSYGDGTPPQLVEDRHGLVIWARNTDEAPKCPVSTQTVAFSHYNHFSAQLPLDASGELVAGGAKEQAAQCLKNVQVIAESIGHSLADTVKVNLYLTDLADAAAVDEAYGEFFAEGTPARRTVGVANLPQGAKVMLDVILGNAEGTPPAK